MCYFVEGLHMKDPLAFQPWGNDWNVMYSYEQSTPLEVLEYLFWNFSFRTLLNRFQTIDNEIGCSNRSSNILPVEYGTVNLENCNLPNIQIPRMKSVTYWDHYEFCYRKKYCEELNVCEMQWQKNTFFGCVKLRILSNEKGVIQLLLCTTLIRQVLDHTCVCALGTIPNPGVQRRVTEVIQGLENKSSQSRIKESCLSDMSLSTNYSHTQGQILQNNKKR